MTSYFDETGGRKIQRWLCTGAHPVRIDLISWYSGILAGTKTKPSILAANLPRSITHSPCLFSEMHLIRSLAMRLFTVNQLNRMRPSTKSGPMIKLPPLARLSRSRQPNTTPNTTGIIRVTTKDSRSQCIKLSMIQRKPNTKKETAKHRPVLFHRDIGIMRGKISYWRTAASMASGVLTF
jgi:hypothetical protein